MTPRPDVGSNHHLDCIYLQLLEAQQEISSIFLIKHDDHGSAELMILHPLNNPSNGKEVRCFTLLSELLMEQLFNSAP